jgi:hypothetical protein
VVTAQVSEGEHDSACTQDWCTLVQPAACGTMPRHAPFRARLRGEPETQGRVRRVPSRWYTVTRALWMKYSGKLRILRQSACQLGLLLTTAALGVCGVLEQ